VEPLIRSLEKTAPGGSHYTPAAAIVSACTPNTSGFALVASLDLLSARTREQGASMRTAEEARPASTTQVKAHPPAQNALQRFKRICAQCQVLELERSHKLSGVLRCKCTPPASRRPPPQGSHTRIQTQESRVQGAEGGGGQLVCLRPQTNSTLVHFTCPNGHGNVSPPTPAAWRLAPSSSPPPWLLPRSGKLSTEPFSWGY
jgi:hypothetical protein